MGKRLFGVDIAAIVDASIRQAGGVRRGTLTKTSPGTRTSSDPTAGTNPETTEHTFQGFVEARETRRPTQVGAQVQTVVTIIGDSVTPTAVPEVNDTAEIDGVTYTLVGLLARDPAEAVYEFSAEA